MEWYIGKDWQMASKGLRKVVLALDFSELEKPTQVSKVRIKIHEVNKLSEHPSKYLKADTSHEIEMGTALTPVDCYLEILLQQMVLGEKAQCFIKTSSGAEIDFIVKLEAIITAKQIHQLNLKEMYERAQRFKEHGVHMFKDYPKFAHDYFVRAAKCLISYKPFDDLTSKNDGVDAADLQALFINIQTNIAACLLTEQRYEDVIYHTEFVETSTVPMEKAIYRRAMAYYHMKEYEKAQKTIERMPKHNEKKEFLKLQQHIAESWKVSNDQYKTVVQRMFSS